MIGLAAQQRRIICIVAIGAVAVGAQPSSGARVPTITRFQRGLSGFPLSITAGPKRSLWFTEGVGANLRGAIGQITTGGRIREYRRGISGDMFAGTAPIAVGGDGDVWFAESNANLRRGWLARITPTGKVHEFRRGISGAVNDLTLGPDKNIWFTERAGVGRITPTGAVKVFRTGIHAPPMAITSGRDGNLWFTEAGVVFHSTGALGRITPAGVVTEFKPPFLVNPSDLTIGPDGNLWYTDSDKIYRVSTQPDGRGGLLGARSFSIGQPDGFIRALTVGPDGALWFAAQHETGFTKVGRITTSGRVSRFGSGLGSSRGSFLDGVAVGPDRNVWFTEAGRGSRAAIDRVRLRG